MKRFTLFCAILLISCTAVNAQLLYRISGNGLKAPSYLVGTYHLAPPAFTDSIPGLREVLKEVAQVYGEIDMAAMMQPANIQKMRQAMIMTDGTTLDKLLSPEEMTRLNALLKELLGADLTHPVLAEQMLKLSPEAMINQLTSLMYLKRTPDFDPNSQIDSYLQKVARESKKKVGALETIDEQLKILFGSIPYERQKVLLMCLVDNRQWTEQMVDDLVKAYFSQNMENIQAAFDEKMGTDCDATDEENHILIDGRNEAWMKKLPAIMKTNATLVAVGAGHLVGEKGLLSMMKNAGYTVEIVK